MNENPTPQTPGSPGPGLDPDATIFVTPPMPRSNSVEQAGEFIGPYQLIEPLGEGGFGTVWRAEQKEPIHREVALKVIKLGMDSREIIARFEAERQALALMDHPNIAAVLDAGTTKHGRPFFAMELVKGVPITDYCDANKLSIRKRLELFIPVCQAVQHAHQKSILHRDLKPTNILVMEVDGKPVPKVIDFGIAKALHATAEPALHATLAQTLDGLIVGTPQYMSPEQAGSVPDVDTRSDIYTLGVILYELLVGDTPLSREQMKKAALDDMLRLIRESEPQRPSSRFTPATELAKTTASQRHTEPKKLGHALRGDLDWIVLKALEKDRARRYDTANAFAQDLQRHLNDEPVSAGPPSAGYRLRKLVRRNRGTFAAATAVLVALTAGFVSTAWALQREKDAVAKETLQRQSAQQTLAELRATAPAFEAQSRALMGEGKMDDALTKIGFAVSLVPENADYRLARANLLQSMQRLAEAVEEYDRVLVVRPRDGPARLNLAICKNILAMNGGSPELSLALKAKLLTAIKAQHRDLETTQLARQTEREHETAWDTLQARLAVYVKQERWGSNRMSHMQNFSDGKTHVKLDLSSLDIGDLNILRDQPITELNLRHTTISDLRPLAGLPLEELDLLQCQSVSDLSPLRGMKLKKLIIDVTHVADLKPLAGMPLRTLTAQGVHLISDISPLNGMPLTYLILRNCEGVQDLSPLAESKIETLDITATNVTNLSPLRSTPLRSLIFESSGMTSPKSRVNWEVLAGHPTLETLRLSDDVEDITFLRTLPKLKNVILPAQPFISVGFSVAEFFAAYDPALPEIAKARAALIAGGLKNPRVQAVALDEKNDLRIYLAGGRAAYSTPLLDLGPLRKLPIKHLAIGRPVSDLEPLREMPLIVVCLFGGGTMDVGPLADCHDLEEILLPEHLQNVQNVDRLRSLPKLRLLSSRLLGPSKNGKTSRPAQTAEEFWKEYDAKNGARAK